MNEQELSEIEARCAAATDGPWYPCGKDKEADRYGYNVRAGDSLIKPDGSWSMPWEIIVAVGWISTRNECPPKAEENAAFIAAARTDVPALAAEVRRLREWLAGIAYLSGAEDYVVAGLRGDPYPPEAKP